MKQFITIIVFSFFLFACGGSDNDSNQSTDIFIGLQEFSFLTSIKPETLTQEENLAFYESYFIPREATYLIETVNDLENFNQTLSEKEKIGLGNLETNSYFLIRAPYGCNDYFKYADNSYKNLILTITMNHYKYTFDEACPAVITDKYHVFNAKKQ